MLERQQNRSELSRRTVVAAGAVTALAATALGAATSAQAATESAGGLKVGVGKAAFTPAASLLPLDNFTAVHDDLNVRVLLVESGSRRIALAVLDLTSISAEAISLMRDAITAASGVATANIMVTVTHCFSAPHVQASSSSAGAAAYVQNIVAATKSAVADAVKNLQDAEVGYGSGRSDVNVNRNVLTADGYWLGVNEQLPSDKGVFAGVEPELSTTTATAIRENSSFSSTFVMSMFEGGAKNMPDKWNFNHVTYEAVDGFYIKGTAEKAVARIDRIIKSLN
jgi:hypothetical protein